MSINAESLAELKGKIDSSWTYLEVLALAMAKAQTTRFITHRELWNRLVADFQEQTKTTSPELLDGIYFDSRNPESPFSQEVSGFLAVMRRSGSLVVWGSGYQVWEMDIKVKDNIKTNLIPILQPYESIIDSFAQQIDKQLAV